MTVPNAPESWKDVDAKTIDFVFSQAEKILNAQFQSALSSDQRASSAASVFVGFSGVAIAAAVAFWSKANLFQDLGGGLACGLMLLITSGFCFYAARPIDFEATGNQPENWYQCLGTPLSEAKGVEIENYQDSIEKNDIALGEAAKNLVWGYKFAFAAPVVGAMAYWVISTF